MQDFNGRKGFVLTNATVLGASSYQLGLVRAHSFPFVVAAYQIANAFQRIHAAPATVVAACTATAGLTPVKT